MMKELLKTIVENLVDYPEKIVINEIKGEQTTILELKVAPSDMGKVIGKQGRIAKSIRAILKASAIHNNQRVTVEIIQSTQV